MSFEYGLVFTFFFWVQFDIPYSILFVQVTLSHFSKFEIIVGISLPCLFLLIHLFCAKKKQKTIFNSKVTSHVGLLCPSFACKLPYRMNVRTSQNMLGAHC